MTENEAKEELKCYVSQSGTSHPEEIEIAIKALEEVQQYREIGTPEELQDMKNNYFEALSDWRQYRKIGTLEECRAAIEKQTAKKPKEYEDKYYDCPTCGNVLLHKWDKYLDKLMDKSNGLPYCLGCGQKLDWRNKA